MRIIRIYNAQKRKMFMTGCGYPPKPDKGKVTPVNLTGMTNVTFTLAQQECNRGHLETGGNGHIWCESGQWLGIITCTPVDCGSHPIPANGNVTLTISGKTTYGSTATQYCNTGYKMAAGKADSRCHPNRQWNSPITCLKDCGPAPKPEHGNVSLTKPEQTFHGSTAIQSCDSGYKMATGKGSITCQESGNWTASFLCLKVVTATSVTLTDINGTFQNSSQYLDASNNKGGILSNPGVVAGMSYVAGGITLSPVVAFVYNVVAKHIKVSSGTET